VLLSKVKETVTRYHLLTQGDRVVVGVSGGVDSMVLLRLLDGLREDFKLSLIVAHINHGLRPDESEREAELVREESVRLGLPFEYGRFDAKTFSRTGGFSLQDGARRLRYHFLQGLLLKHRAQKIALGHHADDQVETFLSRLLRGSGLRGLRGMLPMRDQTVIRPLLEAWKEEIVSFASQERVPYLHDSSNLKEDYLRNRLRLHLIPLLEKNYQSNFRKRILKTSALLREEDDCLEEEAKNAYDSLIREEENGLAFRFSEFQSYRTPIQRRVVQGLLHKVYG